MSVRNPDYPNGATLTDIVIQNQVTPNCQWCGRNGDLSLPETHDGMCPHPFMQAADSEIGWLRWALQVIFRYWMHGSEVGITEKQVYEVLALFDQNHRGPKGKSDDPKRGDSQADVG